MPRALTAHRPGRLLFAVFTLSVALAGVAANFSLSHNAINAFDQLIAFSDKNKILITARTRDALEISRNQSDARHLHETLLASVRAAAPEATQIVPLRRFETHVETAGIQRPIAVYAVGSGFLEATNATRIAGTEGWNRGQDKCALGLSAAILLNASIGDSILLGAAPCRLTAILDIPERPPFTDLNAAFFVPFNEQSFDPRTPLSVFILVSGPSDRLETELLRKRLDIPLDIAYLQIWSSTRGQEEAQRLKRIVVTISNGLGIVILLIGSASIASLMSFSVAERRREIAIRITIGASRRNILMQFIGEALAISSVALVLGIAGGIFLSDYLEHPLNEFLVVGDMTSLPFSLVPVAKTMIGFLVIMTLSALGPALQATRTDPAQVLRNS